MHAPPTGRTTSPERSQSEASGGSGGPGGPGERIVVGVDGSAPSQRAVTWAADQAARRGANLEIVSVWEPPDFGPEAYEYAPPGPDVDEAAVDEARRRAAGAAELARQVLPAEQVRTTVLCGGAAEVLVEKSKDADLLVVGSRGRGGFRGLLLGSVSQQCAGHASCPVVVVRSARTASAS